MRQKHNKNTTFYWSGDVIYQQDGTFVNLDDYLIKSQVRDRSGNLIADLTVNKDKPQLGQIEIIADSSIWCTGSAVWDIVLTKDGITVATESVDLTITEGNTHA